MGRPRSDPETRVSVQLAPPDGLKAATRKLWHREFDRFPPGYFVPADIRGMLLYLDWIGIYDTVRRAVARAKGDEQLAYLAELRQIAAKVITLQRALRMYPSTRAHGETHRNMANDPTQQTGEERPGMEPWERIMEQTGNLPKSAN